MQKYFSIYRILAAIIILALVSPALVMQLRDSQAAPKTGSDLRATRPPRVEQLVFAPIGPDRARQLNAGIPFSPDRGPSARPFYLIGDPASRARAIDCLASAMWYEAGNDPAGQRAVGQVVLNRLRHPAYPSSVCEVVFEGSEHATGCQFTFTCDGALARRPSETAFAAARANASAMLEGKVDPAPGLATHYHTDWVHPLWSARLDKIARIGPHLFFRWHGPWGSAGAFRQGYGGQEPIIAKLAVLSPAHMGLADGMANGDQELAAARQKPGGIAELGEGSFALAMSASRSSNVQGMAALEACGDQDWCKVVGRIDGNASPVFLYIRDRRNAIERALWDCDVFKRPTSTQCLAPDNRSWIAYNGKLPPVR